VNRRNRTYGSCYSSPHVQSQLVIGSPPFQLSYRPTHAGLTQGFAQPPRINSRVTVGLGLEAIRIATGTPALVIPSTARRQTLSPGNALPGTIRPSRSASKRPSARPPLGTPNAPILRRAKQKGQVLNLSAKLPALRHIPR
jgi:hypothetical protein